MSAGSKSALQPNIVFDQSGKLILYAALPGIKIVNLVEVLSFLHATPLLRSFLPLLLAQALSGACGRKTLGHRAGGGRGGVEQGEGRLQGGVQRTKDAGGRHDPLVNGKGCGMQSRVADQCRQGKWHRGQLMCCC